MDHISEMDSLEQKNPSRDTDNGSLILSAKDIENQWNQFYEKELDALQWAKEFMDAYERKRGRKVREET